MESQAIPSPELQHLNFLIGNWHSEGDLKSTKISPAKKIKGTDVYEWILEGFFLVHRVDVIIGDEKVKAIEVISYDASKKTYLMRSFDNKGQFVTMHARVKDGTMKISGEKIRSTLVSKDSNHMVASWERTDDGKKWVPWMDMKFTKAE